METARIEKGIATVVMTTALLFAFASCADAETLGYRPPVKALISILRQRYPHATARFANCPGNNKLPREDGSDGQVCEFRVVDRQGIFKGVGTDGSTPTTVGARRKALRARTDLLRSP